MPDQLQFTIAAREAWVEVLPIGKLYYRHQGGGLRLTAGEHVAVLDHKKHTFTIEKEHQHASS